MGASDIGAGRVSGPFSHGYQVEMEPHGPRHAFLWQVANVRSGVVVESGLTLDAALERVRELNEQLAEEVVTREYRRPDDEPFLERSPEDHGEGS